MLIFRAAAVTALSLVAAACGAEQPPAADSAAADPRAASRPAVLDLGAIEVDPPPAWSFRQPTSSMRLAEAEVPGPGGPALLTVFFFGPGGGGGVEANLERWIGQVEAAPGGEPARSSFETGPFTVTTVTVDGTLLPSRMSGGPSEPVPGSRLLGAVVEGPGGPWFFKLTGPVDTVAAAAADLEAMLRSVRAT